MRNTTGELTPREKEIVESLIAGMVAKEIGCKLSLTTGTINQYVAVIKRKMGAKTTVQAVALFIGNGCQPLS
jgi:LuxR family maltose regulon positive regulatory protein